ncbi:MAG TPA: YcaO-like family protein [Sphingomonas sp.]|nr:YcaO-like family protein [Sphingomonas sp.]
MNLSVPAANRWSEAAGQHRARPISATLLAARQAAKAAGVTRLSDVSGLAPFRIPVFQATRPFARLLSVSQGKGLTARAAMVSALLESVEHDCAERLAPGEAVYAIDDRDDGTRNLWARGARDPLAVTLDPALQRSWVRGHNLMTGGEVLIPWDLLSLDTVRHLPSDIRLASVGLATGNTHSEACVGAVAELIEHDLQAAMRHHSASERRACELDLDSIDDGVIRAVIARICAGGFAVRVWSMGQEAGIAAFRCSITDLDPGRILLPPAGGTGCHPDRSTAFLRAILEAVQSRVTLIAGARDDLTIEDYRGGAEQTLNLILGALSFGPGPLDWSKVPHCPKQDADAGLDLLLSVAARRSPLPVLLYTHRAPHPDLVVVHAIGPGLCDLGRGATPQAAAPVVRAVRSTTKSRRPVLFVGPSLDPALIPDNIEIRAPAICGDLAALLADPPPAVGLVDGCFEIAPTVWHKEILDLMAHGVPIAGAASLGALRAAELHMFGMIGIGRIFAAYADESVVRDDAVLLSHAPAELDWRPLTVALVDAEAALQQADLSPPERRQMQRIVRRADFRHRTWKACLETYHERVGKPFSLGEEQLARLATAKQADALALVAALAAGLPLPSARPRPPLTALYELMLRNLPQPPLTAHLPASAHALPA